MRELIDLGSGSGTDDNSDQSDDKRSKSNKIKRKKRSQKKRPTDSKMAFRSTEVQLAYK